MAQSALRRIIANPLETPGQRARQVLPTPVNKNFVRRYMMPENFPAISNPDGTVSTHRMASAEVDGRNIAYPMIIQDPATGKLTPLDDDQAFDYALRNNEYLTFPDQQSAQAFAEGGYKSNGMNPPRNMQQERMDARRARIGMEPYDRQAPTQSIGSALRQFVSLDTPENMSLGATVADMLMGFAPGIGTAQGIRDFERARRDDDTLGMVLGGVGVLPIAGGIVKTGKAVAKAAEGALDMSQAARMQRATEMGFNPKTLYHATSSDIDQFSKNMMGKSSSLGSGQKAVWLNTSPDVVETYLPGAFVNRANVKDSADLGDGVGRYYSEGGNIMPVRARLNPENTEVFDMGGARYDEQTVNDILKNAKKNKAKAVVFKNIRDEGVMGLGSGRRATSIAVFNPSDIRSVNAAFDPSKRGSANLMAGAAGATIGLSALRNINQQEEK